MPELQRHTNGIFELSGCSVISSHLHSIVI